MCARTIEIQAEEHVNESSLTTNIADRNKFMRFENGAS